MVLPHFRSASIISLGQLCDDNCNLLLTKKELYTINNNKLMLKGDRNLIDGLWDIFIEKRTSANHKPAPPITNPTISPTVAPYTLPPMPDNASYTSNENYRKKSYLSIIICKKEHVWNWHNAHTHPFTPVKLTFKTQLRATISAHGHV